MSETSYFGIFGATVKVDVSVYEAHMNAAVLTFRVHIKEQVKNILILSRPIVYSFIHSSTFCSSFITAGAFIAIVFL